VTKHSQHDEWVLVIDSERSVTLTSTQRGTYVMTLEDPLSVTIVEIPAEEAGKLRDELTRRLAK
jgi:hypothetical protein